MTVSGKIAIGVITCERPQGLRRLLASLSRQKVGEADAGEWLVIVVDNDLTGANKEVVAEAMAQHGLPVLFVEEPQRGIPFARNACVRAALANDYAALIFVDDDEEAPEGWLAAMLGMWRESAADCVTGPVEAILPDKAPCWAVKSGAFNKQYPYPRGQAVRQAFTNNTLVSRAVLETMGPEGFDLSFRYSGSSDIHYFMRVHKEGFKILWCPEAVIYEHVPPSRLRYAWIIRRGFRAGAGDAISRMKIDRSLRTVAYVLGLAAARCAIGGAQVMLCPFTRWRGLITGTRRFASGIGTLMGLCGVNYQEYKIIHGD